MDKEELKEKYITVDINGMIVEFQFGTDINKYKKLIDFIYENSMTITNISKNLTTNENNEIIINAIVK